MQFNQELKICFSESTSNFTSVQSLKKIIYDLSFLLSHNFFYKLKIFMTTFSTYVIFSQGMSYSCQLFNEHSRKEPK